jgi:glucitol operon activator protein
MSGWPYLLLAFGVLWVTQIAGTWLQTRHYRQVLEGITSTGTEGFVGVGNARATLGKGVIMILVAGSDGTLRDALAMRGRTVFARFKPAPELVGLPVAAVAAAGDPPVELDRGVAAAARQAAEQVLKVRGAREPQVVG